MYGNRQFTGSLVPRIAGGVYSVSQPIVPGPNTTVGGTESFIMDVGSCQAGSFQVNVLNIGVAASTLTVTQSSGVNTTSGLLTLATGTGFVGNLVRATSSGTLPTGIAGATNYYVYIVTGLGIQLFSSLANVLLAQASYAGGLAPTTATGLVIPSAIGSGTMTLTPTALGTTTYTMQGSNDYVPGSNENESPVSAGTWTTLATGESPAGAVSQTITTTGSSYLAFWYPTHKYIQIVFSVAAGTAQIQVIGHSA